MEQLTQIFLEPSNFAIIVATWVLIDTYRRMFPMAARSSISARLEPLLPLLIASGFLWIPGVAQEALGVGDKLVLGIVLGWGTGWAHKFLGQSIRGRDQRIKPQVLE